MRKIILINMIIGLIGCTYHFRSFNTHNVNTLFIETFNNSTNEMNAGINFTGYLLDYIRQNNIFELVDNKSAEAILRGNIIELNNRIYNIDIENNIGNAEDYQLYIKIEIKLINNKTDDVIWENNNFHYEKLISKELVEDEEKYMEELNNFLSESAEMVMNDLLGDW